MIILSIESSTPVAGAAVGTENEIWAECFLNRGLTHSEILLELIDQCLTNASLKISEVEAIAVTTGPGSFTGLRIGLATAKGFAQVGGQKLIPVPTLDALAANLWNTEGLICPLLNARRREVYTALYRQENGEQCRVGDYRAITPEELAAELVQKGEKVNFLGDGVAPYQDFFREKLGEKAVFAPAANSLLRAASTLSLAGKIYSREGGAELFSLLPFYLRRSEAELKKEEKTCKK